MCPCRRGVLLMWLMASLGLGAAARSHAEESKQAPAKPRTDLYGDPLPEHARLRLGTVRWRHPQSVAFVGFTAKDTEVVTACADGYFRIWDVGTGKEKRRFGRPNPNNNYNLPRGQRYYDDTRRALSPDGRILAVATNDGSVQLWQVGDGKEIRKISQPTQKGGVFYYGSAAMAFSPDGKILATRRSDGLIRFWQVADGKELRQLGQLAGQNQFFGNGDNLTFSRDGKMLALGARDNQGAVIRIYDVASGKERAISPPPNTFFSPQVALSPDGKTLALGSTLIDTASGKVIRRLAEGNQFGPDFGTTPMFSPDGKFLVVIDSAKTIQIWDLKTRKVAHRLGGAKGSLNYVYSDNSLQTVAFSTDGKTLADATMGNTVQIWSTATGTEIAPHNGHVDGVSAVSMTPDGKMLVTYSTDHTVRRWDAASGKELRRFRPTWLGQDAGHLVLNGNGKFAAGTLLNLAVVWDVMLGRTVRSVRLKTQQTFPGVTSQGLALSPDGKSLAAWASDRVLHVFETATGKERYRLAESEVKTDSNNAGVIFFNGNNTVLPMMFSPDGEMLATITAPITSPYVAAAADSSAYVRVWEPARGKRSRPFAPPPAGIHSMAFAPDGRIIVTGQADDSISFWEVLTGNECLRIKQRPDPKPSKAKQRLVAARQASGGSGVAISPDGRFLAGAAPDHAVCLWDFRSGKELARLKGHQAPVLAVAFTPNGRGVISGAEDSTALVWDVGSLLKDNATAAPTKKTGLQDLWSDLAGDATRAFKAVNALGATPKETVALIREHLQPAKTVPDVRIKQLITGLDNSSFAVRQKATKELERLDDLAQPALKQALETAPSLETRKRAERLLDYLASGQTPAGDVQRSLRAVYVLELLATPEARAVLQNLALGAPGAKLTRHAAQALKRLQAANAHSSR